jgi:hypothetical protein
VTVYSPINAEVIVLYAYIMIIAANYQGRFFLMAMGDFITASQ